MTLATPRPAPLTIGDCGPFTLQQLNEITLAACFAPEDAE